MFEERGGAVVILTSGSLGRGGSTAESCWVTGSQLVSVPVNCLSPSFVSLEQALGWGSVVIFLITMK